MIEALARDLGALALFPFGGPPFWPFQQWARRSEPVHPSPIGLLIHPRYGLWHSYRGALGFREALDVPELAAAPSPCELLPRTLVLEHLPRRRVLRRRLRCRRLRRPSEERGRRGLHGRGMPGAAGLPGRRGSRLWPGPGEFHHAGVSCGRGRRGDAPSAASSSLALRYRRSTCAIVLCMTTATLNDPILERLRAALTEIYGDRLERVVLFGSRRGDAAGFRLRCGGVSARHARPHARTEPPCRRRHGHSLQRGRFRSRHAVSCRLVQRTNAFDARNPDRGHRPLKPETALFLEKSRELLDQAETMLGVGLPLYVAEFELPYNNRGNPDIFGAAIGRC